MLSTITLDAPNDHTLVLKLIENNHPLPFSDVIVRWQHDEDFRASYIALLQQSPYPAFGWETPPVTTDSLDQDFQYALTNRPWLADRADPGPFQGYLTAAGPGARTAAFPNLGGDALLIIPLPGQGPQDAYAHLGSFLRAAPADQQHALWKRIGKETTSRLSSRPLWLNTAGGGVDWLHVRLDSRPKYYRYPPYLLHKTAAEDS